MTISEYQAMVCGKRAVVLGYGVSNRPLVDFLVNLGVTVEVRDKKLPDADAITKLSKQNVTLITGDAYLENISCDYIFRSPGIRPDHAEIEKALQKGAVLRCNNSKTTSGVL